MAKKKFKLEIDLGNDAMQDPYAVGLALLKVREEIQDIYDLGQYSTEEHSIRDINGNRVGYYKFTD